jgi:tetratricopeptide (TPR) repeat protein
LDIKYSKKKEEMRHDPIIEFIVKARTYAGENSSTLLSVLVVILLVVAGFSAYSYVKKSGQRHATDAFGKAMMAYVGSNRVEAVEALSLVADKHRNTAQAAYAAYLLGQTYLMQEDYKEAITWLEIASRNAKAGFVEGQALESLASCYEATQDYERSVEYLQKALKTRSAGFRYPAIRWKAALACRQLGRNDETRQYCRDILSDTLAVQYRQKAENLITEIDVL